MVALIVSLVGVGLAYSAFRDQQAVNRDQQTINRDQQRQERMRYAVRVSYWEQALILASG